MPVDVDGTAQLLIGQLESVESALNDELRTLLGDPRWRYRSGRLRNLIGQIDAAKDDIAVAGQKWINGPFREAYAQAATDAAGRLAGEFAWSQFHTEGFQMLATDTFDDVLEATRHMGDDVKALIRQVGKEAAVTGEVAGRTALQSADAMAADLRRRGLTAVTYVNGSRHGIGEFSRMLMRTKTALARNLGSMSQYRELGVQVVEIVDGLDCGLGSHHDTQKADGLILPLNEAAGYPLSHPNCVRDFLPRPDVRPEDTGRAEGLVEPSRWEDQRRFEAYLARERITREGRTQRRAPRSTRQLRTPRRPRGRTPTAAELRRMELPTPDVVTTGDGTLQFWTRGGQLHPDRAVLHRKIRAEFVEGMPTPDKPEMVFTGGGPASGKSSMVDANPNRFPSSRTSVHIDPDAVKKSLPEYEHLVKPGRGPDGIDWDDIDPSRDGFDSRAAAFTHEESSLLSKQVIADSLEGGHDILYDSVGDSGIAKLSGKVEEAREAGHRVSAHYATNDLSLAEQLSANRARKTGREVPVSYLRSAHADVTDTFLDAMQRELFDEATLWDTNVYQQPRQVAHWNGKQFVIADDALFADFVAKGTRSMDEVLELLEDVLESDATLRLRAEGLASVDEIEDALGTLKHWSDDGTLATLHPARRELHDEIVEAFLADIPIDDDPVVYMTGGGPASGKSTMIDANPKQFPSKTRAVHVDPDAVKAYLPEYRDLVDVGDTRAAAFAHEESSELTKRIIAEAQARRQSVLYDSVGDSGIKKLGGKIDGYHESGSRVIAHYASNDLDLALDLAEKRGVKTGRFVPEEVIRSAHADVTDTFVDAINAQKFDEATLWDTNIYQKPRRVLSFADEVVEIVDDDLFEAFVAKGTRSLDEVMESLPLADDVGDSVLARRELDRRAAELAAKRSEAAKRGAATRARNKAAREAAEAADDLDPDALDRIAAGDRDFTDAVIADSLDRLPGNRFREAGDWRAAIADDFDEIVLADRAKWSETKFRGELELPGPDLLAAQERIIRVGKAVHEEVERRFVASGGADIAEKIVDARQRRSAAGLIAVRQTRTVQQLDRLAATLRAAETKKFTARNVDALLDSTPDAALMVRNAGLDASDLVDLGKQGAFQFVDDLGTQLADEIADVKKKMIAIDDEIRTLSRDRLKAGRRSTHQREVLSELREMGGDVAIYIDDDFDDVVRGTNFGGFEEGTDHVRRLREGTEQAFANVQQFVPTDWVDAVNARSVADAFETPGRALTRVAGEQMRTTNTVDFLDEAVATADRLFAHVNLEGVEFNQLVRLLDEEDLLQLIDELGIERQPTRTPGIRITDTGSGRASASAGTNSINVGGTGDWDSVMAHELQHIIDNRIPGLSEHEWGFVARRFDDATGNGRTSPMRRRDQVRGASVEADGYVTEAGFTNPYTGRLYDLNGPRSGSSEVMTTGVQGVWDDAFPVTSQGGFEYHIGEDDEFRDFVLGMLALL